MDLDADGNVDLLSGSWPGELHLFRGGAGRTFAAPEKLRHANGKLINAGGGRTDGFGPETFGFAGDATTEMKDGKTYVVYDGERIEVPAGKSPGITGTASAPHAVDWDADGNLDLLVGEIDGKVHFVENQGTAKAWSFAQPRDLVAAGQALKVEGDAGPFVADWDGDGDVDLLCGSGDGSVSLFRNSAKAKEVPVLGAAETLVPDGATSWGADAPKEPRRGVRSKICVADWDGDGRLDLLVGDFATQKPDLPAPTPEDAAVHAKTRKEVEVLQGRYRQISAKLSGRPRVEGEEREKLTKEMNSVREKMQELSAKLPREYDNHGWVWLFLSRRAEGASSVR